MGVEVLEQPPQPLLFRISKEVMNPLRFCLRVRFIPVVMPVNLIKIIRYTLSRCNLCVIQACGYKPLGARARVEIVPLIAQGLGPSLNAPP